MYGTVLLLHVLAATVWTGGHLVLAIAILPRVLRTRDVAALRAFESAFEKVGLPSLLIQVATGLWMAHAIVPDPAAWFDFSMPASHLIALKLGLLAATVATAADARLRVIPRLTPDTLPAMARRIVLVTLLAVLFVATGVSFRTGLL